MLVGVHYECVPFPMANRVALPGKFEGLRVISPVREDLANHAICFVEDDQLARSLKDYEGKRNSGIGDELNGAIGNKVG